MFKWPMLAAATAAATFAIAFQPAEARAQEIEMIFAIPAQTLTFTAHFVAHDAGFFKKEGLKVAAGGGARQGHAGQDHRR